MCACVCARVWLVASISERRQAPPPPAVSDPLHRHLRLPLTQWSGRCDGQRKQLTLEMWGCDRLAGFSLALSVSPRNFLQVCFSTSRFALSAKAAHIFCCIGLCAENFLSVASPPLALECGRNTNGAEKPRLHTQMNKASKMNCPQTGGMQILQPSRSGLSRQRGGGSAHPT